ncbi:triacylglycerol lipase [Thozetella sp. PMI_491]|nr:triacylglycerol lipase [Thozetella sp. PMI_491]
MASSWVSFLLALGAVTATSVSRSSWAKSTETPIARARNGTYAGVYSAEFDQDFFLGVPFAQPPVGGLRFRQAQPLNTTWNDTRHATEYAAECYGYGSDQWVLGNHVSEDCLTLNVIRPHNATSKLPVGVWIHGGGFFMGGNADPRYNLSFIVQQSVSGKTPFIGVSINYRLQGFGFLFGKEALASGAANIGIHDQRLALRWIQENIAAFGGDPARVTIWGESAGGNSVGFHMIAYGGRDDGLFRAGIMQSGDATGRRFLTAEEWQPRYDKLVNATNCTGTPDTLDCLRKLPIQTLNSALNSSVTSGWSWIPGLDHDFIQERSGTTQVMAGRFLKVPILHGRNHDEGTSLGARRGVNTTEQFLDVLRAAGADNSTAAILAALYPDIPEIGIPATLKGRPPPSKASLGSMWKRVAAFNGDYTEHTSRRITSEAWARQNVTSYSYHFNVLPAGLDQTVGVTHFQEVSFVMRNIHGLGYQNAVATNPFAGMPDSYAKAATIMAQMWASFISDLDPNASGASSVHWPVYQLEAPRNIVFDANATGLAYVEPDTYRAEAIAYMASIFVSVLGK